MFSVLRMGSGALCLATALLAFLLLLFLIPGFDFASLLLLWIRCSLAISNACCVEFLDRSVWSGIGSLLYSIHRNRLLFEHTDVFDFRLVFAAAV